jgi:hypothetical protein
MDLEELLSPKTGPAKQAAGLNLATILTARGSEVAIWQHYNQGALNGETTHFDAIDQYWTWMRGELNTVTGYPNHGKSEFVLQLMVIKAALSGWKFAIYGPESVATKIFLTIIQMYIGGSANAKDKGKGHYLTPEEVEHGLAFAEAHFFVLRPAEDEKMGPAEALAYFDYIHKTHGLDGCMLDPWNQLDHDDTTMREDQYISGWLTKIKRFAQRKEVAFFVTAHPAGDVTDRATGELRVPKAYNISGGKMWNNKSDNVLAVHRPKFPASETEVWIHKIKQWGLVGKAGMVLLDYRPEAFRYFAINGSRSPLDKLHMPKIDTDRRNKHL